jgi:hypothetical protein
VSFHKRLAFLPWSGHASDTGSTPG